jgi:hypothetical protein
MNLQHLETAHREDSSKFTKRFDEMQELLNFHVMGKIRKRGKDNAGKREHVKRSGRSKVTLFCEDHFHSLLDGYSVHPFDA